MDQDILIHIDHNDMYFSVKHGSKIPSAKVLMLARAFENYFVWQCHDIAV